MYQIYADGNLIYQPANENLRLISPKLTVEMGKAGGLNFGIPPTNNYYGNLQQLKALLTVEEDGVEIFRGRVLSNTRNFNNVRNIYGEGDLSYLVDSVQLPKKYKGKAKELLMQIIDNHNAMIQGSVSLSDGGYAPLVDRDEPTSYASWQPGPKQFKVGVISNELKDIDVYIAGKDEDITDKETNKFDYNQIVINGEVDNWKTTFDFIENSLIDYAGGYLRTRYENGITYIDWYKEYYKESNQTISFGKNLLDLTEENNAEDAFSVLIPIGDENLTITKASDDTGDENVTKFDRELIYKPALEKYGRIVKTNVFDGVSKAKTLKENGIRYLKEHAIPPITFTVTAVDMHLLNSNVDPIRVGDKVHILSAPHELDDSDLICTKIEYDLTNPANTKYTFGKPKQSLTERYRQDRKPKQGGGGGGGAAKKAEENSEDKVLEIYKSWVTYDPNDSKVDIGALYKLLNPNETIAIQSMPQILLGADANGNTINLQSTFEQNTKNMIHNYAGITVQTGTNGPQLNLYINEGTDENGNPVNSANITMNVDEIARYTDEDGHVHTTYGSKIALSADVTEIDSKIFTLNNEVTNIITEYAKIDTKILEVIAENLKITANSGYIQVPGIYTNHLLLDNYSIQVHTHELTANSSGKVTIGAMDKTGAEHSFNMADTQFYKEHVSASLKHEFDKANCGIRTWTNNTFGNKVLSESFTNTYQAKSVTIDYVVSESKKSYKITPTVKNKNGETITSPTGAGFGTTYTDSTVYNNGFKATRVSSISYSGGDYVRITLTNGNVSSWEL